MGKLKGGDSPIDEEIIRVGQHLFPLFRYAGFSANDITSFSVISGGIALYAFTQRRFTVAAVTYLISNFFDILDGAYARTYGETSVFGDFYDRATDIIVSLPLIYLIWNSNKTKINTSIFLILLITTFIHNVALDKRDKKDNYTTQFFYGLLPRDTSGLIEVTKYLSSSVLILFMSYLMYIQN